MKTRNILLEMGEPTDSQFKRLLNDALKDVLIRRKIGEKNFQYQMKTALLEAEKRFLNRK
jgi:hypothetical protein